MTPSRREFGKLALAALPLGRRLARGAATIDSKIEGVQLGVQSYSFRTLPLNAAIAAMAADGLGECELFSPHIEGGHTDVAPSKLFAPRPPSPTSGQGSAPDGAAGRWREDPAHLKEREELRKWRLSVPLDYFKGIRQQFTDAGINLYAYNLSFNDSFSDAEIDRGFEMAKALGVHFITASTTLPVAKRVAPFADKHAMAVAMHGHSNLKDPNEFAKPESFAQALEMSKYFKINLDIGHFTAANYDAIDYIRQNHENIVLLHLKDRKRNQGENTPWGEGDTPIKQTLLLLKQEKYPIPAFIEYEYKGAGMPQEEVKECYEYAKEVLRSA